MIEEVDGDVLKAEVFAHQCNCVTVRPHGFSRAVALRYSWANVYARRPAYPGRNHSRLRIRPGTIEVDRSEKTTIIHMFAQVLPGEPGRFATAYPGYAPDTFADRQAYFRACVREIEARDFKVVGVPFMIGCGLAGGDWVQYKKILEESSTLFRIYKHVVPG